MLRSRSRSRSLSGAEGERRCPERSRREPKGAEALGLSGASGLGAETARALHAAGVKVALFDLNADKGEALAKELGGVFCKVDVTSEDSVTERIGA